MAHLILAVLFYLVNFALAYASKTADRFIVELAPGQTVGNVVGEIRGSLKDLPSPPQVEVALEYNSPIFSGCSIKVDTGGSPATGDAVSKRIMSVGGVQKMWNVRQVTLDQLPPVSQSGDGPPASSLDVHSMTGVDRLHQEGFFGQNFTVAVIDQGADYLNEFLSGGIGPGFRVSYGRDLVGDSIRPPRSPTKDDDPYADCAPHGSHVAGIIGADAPALNLTGVATAANLEIYRVFDCEGISQNDVILDAILEASNRSVDVINLSLGGGGPFEEDPIASVLNRINNEGKTICIASAGNEGRNGSFTAQAPSGGIYVPAIGSVDAFEVKTPAYVGNFTSARNGSQESFPWIATDRIAFPPVLGLYPLSLDTSVADDGCAPLPPSTPDLSDRLVLIRRGTCSVDDKMNNVAAKGGKYVLIYNNQTSDVPFRIPGNLPDGVLGAASTDGNSGFQLVSAAALANGSLPVTMNSTLFPTTAYTTLDDQNGGLMSTFSSFGPQAQSFLKPSFAAPGGNILSTVARKERYFQIISGTSMAVPYISGVVTLLKQARPELSWRDITNLLAVTSKPLPFSDGTNASYPFLAPAWQQGGGLIAAYDAYRCQTLLDTSALSFNDTRFFMPQLSFEVRNTGADSATYNLTHMPAATILSYRGDGNPNPIPFVPASTAPFAGDEFLRSLTPDFADIAIAPTAFTLAPGASQTVTVSASVAQLEHLRARCPLASGFISINSTRGEVLSLPYGAVGCALSDLPTLDPNEPLIHLVAADNETEYNATLFSTFPLPRIEANRVFTVPRDNSSAAQAGLVLPWLQYKFAQYTQYARIDLLWAGGGGGSGGANSSQTASQAAGDGGNGFGGDSFVATLLNPNVTAADAERLPVAFQNFTGQLPSGAWAPAGRYRFNLSAARLYGDPNGTADFREWVVSDAFVIQYSD